MLTNEFSVFEIFSGQKGQSKRHREKAESIKRISIS
jgi:hypothetical protein